MISRFDSSSSACNEFERALLGTDSMTLVSGWKTMAVMFLRVERSYQWSSGMVCCGSRFAGCRNPVPILNLSSMPRPCAHLVSTNRPSSY